MGIAEEIALFEEKLNELIRKYEQYFLGLEKREPLRLLAEVEKTARRYVGIHIVNTMVKFKYNSQVARLNSYKQYWNRILRLIEEGRYSRDVFRMEMKQLKEKFPPSTEAPQENGEVERLYRLYIEARKACNMGTEKITPDLIKAALDRKKPSLQNKYHCDAIEFRVVIEDGKPKIKARPKG